MAKNEKWEILRKGIVENGGNKLNTERRRNIEKLIMALDKQYMTIDVSVENPNILKSLFYTQTRRDSVLKYRSYSFNYLTPSGLVGPCVCGNPKESGPFIVRITRNKDKSEEQVALREKKKRDKEFILTLAKLKMEAEQNAE